MRLAILPLCALLLSQAAFAQHNIHTFEISTQLFSFNYSEVWPAPQKSDESGFIPGFSLAYTYRGDRLPFYARVSLEYTSSQTTYEGDLIHEDGTFDPLVNRTNNWFRRFELQGGYTFRLARQLTITPYAGYGYRSWSRALSNPGGYGEDYSWNYLPLGVRGDLRISRTFTLGLSAAMRFMFGGSIHLTGYGDDPTMDLGNKLGYRISLPSSFTVSRHWGLGIEPWFEYSAIDKSTEHLVAGTGNFYMWEPPSSTNIFGANLTLQYGF